MSDENNDGQLLMRRMELYFDIYKHHSALAQRFYIMYITIVGGIMVYVYSKMLGDTSNLAIVKSLLLFIIVLSILAMIVCSLVAYFIAQTKALVQGVERKLGIEEYPFGVSICVAIILVVASFLILIVATTFWPKPS